MCLLVLHMLPHNYTQIEPVNSNIMHRLGIVLALLAAISVAVWLSSHPSWSWQNALVGLTLTHLWVGWRLTDQVIIACITDAREVLRDYRPVICAVQCFNLATTEGGGAALGGLLGEDVKGFLDRAIKRLPQKKRKCPTGVQP